MLRELMAIHGELLDALASMGRSTDGEACKRDRVAAARLRLTQVNGKRRRLLQERVFPAMQAADNPRAADAIKRLNAAENEMMARSSAHIARWTIEAVCADWDGYKRDSASIRLGIRDRILLERALLYPLLSLSSSGDSPFGISMSPPPARAAGMLRSQAG